MTSLGSRVIELLRKPATYSSFEHLCQHFKTKTQLPRFNKSQGIGENQINVRDSRLAIPRTSCHKVTYAKFLRKLYPMGDVNHKELYNAYSALPSPQPLYVQPQHFEHLMCQFVNSGGNLRGKNASLLTDVIHGLAHSGMKASAREINNYLYLMNYNQDSDSSTVKSSYSLILEMGEFDMSTFNTFLKFGIAKHDEDFMSKILDDIVANGLKFDRFTYQMLMRYGGTCGDIERCLVFLEMYLEEGHVFDISMINTVIYVLIENEHIEEATKIVDMIFTKPEEDNIIESTYSATHERRMNNQELIFLDSLKTQPQDELLFIPVPTLSTYQPILNYFTSVEQFNLSKIFKYLEEMHDLKIAIPQSIYIKIFNSLKNQDIKELDFIKFILSFMMHEKNLKLDGPLVDSIIGAFLKHSGYQDKMVNGIEEQWRVLKDSIKQSPNSKRSQEIREFSNEAINKLLMLYDPKDNIMSY